MKTLEIKQGIKLHFVQTDKFKTNLLSVFLTTPLDKDTVTKNALIPAILRRGNKNLQTQVEIGKALEEMYGASFDCGIDKIGDNQVIKFYLETISNKYIPEKEDNLEKALNLILDIVFNPLIENNSFIKEYIESEKNNLQQIIEGRKDSKARYALERCIEEMYKEKAYSLYKYGDIKDLEDINEFNLFEHYLELIKNCKIDIYISGDVDENIKETIINNKNITKLEARMPNYVTNNINTRKKQEQKEKYVEEKMDITQGKLIIGLDILNEKSNDIFTALVYNAILGGTPNSKMFQNVREKNSLAYTATTAYLRQKANIFVKCGIEIENYAKAITLIKEQIEDMKNSKFTEEDVLQAKTNIISTIQILPEEQDTELVYYFSQELSGYEIDFEEYSNIINAVTMQDIVDLANRIQINTIYFLRN